MTVVHHPGDARIAHREIPALLAAGHSVTFAAPFAAYSAPRTEGVRTIDLPRAVGRSRLGALQAARDVVRREAPAHDVVLLHDPELLLAVPRSTRTPVVWDVHEDTAAAVSMKSWLPGPVRPAAASGIRRLEQAAEKRVGLLLAEDGYAVRFAREHAVVPNTTPRLDVVLGDALDAVRRGRQRGGNQICAHDRKDADARVQSYDAVWIKHIRAALMENRFRLVQQPIASLQGSDTQMFDVLVRMVDTQGKEVLPSEFMPAAERKRYLSELDKRK